MHWFEDLTEARAKMQAWKQEYNEDRPHGSLKNLTPLQYQAPWHQELAPNSDSHVFSHDSAFRDGVLKTKVAAILEQNGITHVRSL